MFERRVPPCRTSQETLDESESGWVRGPLFETDFFLSFLFWCAARWFGITQKNPDEGH